MVKCIRFPLLGGNLRSDWPSEADLYQVPPTQICIIFLVYVNRTPINMQIEPKLRLRHPLFIPSRKK